MGTPFLGEIKMVTFNFAPRGWTLCNGQIMPINQNQALFSLLGTTYGGNGQTTFALPNLQGRIAVHQTGNGNFVLGESGGESGHTLAIGEIPSHTHIAQSGGTGSSGALSPGNVPGQTSKPFYSPNGTVVMNPAAVVSAGQNQPHDNMAPYLVINFVIALAGVFPSQN